MSGSAGPVVLGVDDRSPWSTHHAALYFALREARYRDVALHVVHGSAARFLVPPPAWSAILRPTPWGRQAVRRVARQAERISRNQVEVVSVSSAASGVEALLEASVSASVLVLQSRGYGASGRVGAVGSISRTVAAHAACPVVIVRGRRLAEPGFGVVVGLEEHGRAQVALHAAVEAAAYRSAPVTAVLAWDAPPTTTGNRAYTPKSTVVSTARQSALVLMAEALAGLREAYPQVELRRLLVRGPVVGVLRQAARYADLLVIGRRSNSGLPTYAIGHAARVLLQDAPCPLMLTAAVRAPRSGRLATARGSDVPIGAGY